MKLLVVIAAALLLAPTTMGAATATIQAESYTALHNIAYNPIRANSGLLEGLDYEGEWTEYTLPVLPMGTYKVTMRCWGNPVQNLLRLVTFPVQGEDPQFIDFSFVGLGTTPCT